jgi:DNA (cytosine-5)-methyltransferase 1
LLGNSKKSGSKKQRTASSTQGSSPDGSHTVGTLLARDYKGFGNQDIKDGRGLIVYENHPTDSRVKEMGSVCSTVIARWGTGGGNVPIALAENTIGRQPLNGGNGTGFTEGGPMYTLNATGVHGVAYGFEPGIAKREGNPSRFVENGAPTLRANMGDNQTAVAMAVDVYNQAIDGDVTATLTEACGGTNTSGPKVIAPTLTASNNPSRSPQSTEVTNQVASVYAASMAVRRLTPIECERLQGFPDNHTMIPWRKKPAEDCPDGPRYKAMGNSMAVPVMNWIGKRIQMVQS